MSRLRSLTESEIGGRTLVGAEPGDIAPILQVVYYEGEVTESARTALTGTTQVREVVTAALQLWLSNFGCATVLKGVFTHILVY